MLIQIAAEYRFEFQGTQTVAKNQAGTRLGHCFFATDGHRSNTDSTGKLPLQAQNLPMPKRKEYSSQAFQKQLEALRASLKRKPCEKLFAEGWAKYKAEERALEAAKEARLSALRRH